MQIRTRLFREYDGRTRWTADAVHSLVGQTTKLNGFEQLGFTSDSAKITEATIEDGWVVVTFSEE